MVVHYSVQKKQQHHQECENPIQLRNSDYYSTELMMHFHLWMKTNSFTFTIDSIDWKSEEFHSNFYAKVISIGFMVVEIMITIAITITTAVIMIATTIIGIPNLYLQ